MFDEPELAAAAALRAEWRADEEAWSRAALERWEHGRTLVDVLRDGMHRGDTVAFAFTSWTFTGALAAVGVDVACVATTAGAVDVRVDPAMPVLVRVAPREPNRGAGHRGDDRVTSFLARLRELEGTRVHAGVHPAGEALTGELRLGRDHVSVVDRHGGRLYVPMASVWWVRPDDDD